MKVIYNFPVLLYTNVIGLINYFLCVKLDFASLYKYVITLITGCDFVYQRVEWYRIHTFKD